MNLQLMVLGENQWDRIIIPNVKLQAGEVLDIGKVEFGPALKVKVLVVDSAGKPVEGVTVRQFNEKGYYQGRQGITDVDGIAFLDIPRYSTGEFAVEKQLGCAPDGSWQEPLREGVSYKVAGEQDNGKVFILQLSEQFLKVLF
jgi:hypothetical protein